MICSSVCRFRVMAPSCGPISAQSDFLANGLVFGGKVKGNPGLYSLEVGH
jgi:hypothetical protein